MKKKWVIEGENRTPGYAADGLPWTVMVQGGGLCNA